MEVSQTCYACGSSACTSCRARLTNFVALLAKVDKRVSTSELTSNSTSPEAHAAIDKLTLELDHPVPIDRLRKLNKRKVITTKRVRLRNKGWFLELLNPKVNLYLRIIKAGDKELFWQVVSNPAACPLFSEYLSVLRTFLIEDEINQARLSRLDIAIDFKRPLTDILQSLNIPNKRARTAFIDEGAKRTGIMIGKGNEKLVVYDKAHKLKSNESLTRVEVQLSGSKMPTRSLIDLPNSLMKWIPRNILGKVELNDVKLINNLGLLSKANESRLNELRILLPQDGYFATRNQLNRSRNFDRDYKPLITLNPWKTQLVDITSKDFEKFFNYQERTDKCPRK